MRGEADVERISAVFRFCSKFSIFPFDWTEKGGLEVRSSKYLPWFTKGVNLILWVQIVAAGFQFLEIRTIAGNGPRSFEEFGVVILLALIRLGIFIFQETVWEFRDELADLVFKTLHVQKLHEKFDPGSSVIWNPKKETEYLRLFLYGLSLTVITWGGLSVVIDVSCGRAKGAWEFLLIVIANGLVYSRHLLNVYVIILSIVPSILNLIFWLRKCLSDATASDFIKLQQSVRVYRWAALFCQLFNTVFGYYFIPYEKSLLTLVLMGSTYGVICFGKTLNPFTYAGLLVIFVTSIVCLLMTSLATSSFYNYSRKFKKNLSTGIAGVRDPHVRKGLEREWTSCPLIRCQVGSFYYMEEKAKLTMVDSIIHGITFLLVSFE